MVKHYFSEGMRKSNLASMKIVKFSLPLPTILTRPNLYFLGKDTFSILTEFVLTTVAFFTGQCLMSQATT